MFDEVLRKLGLELMQSIDTVSVEKSLFLFFTLSIKLATSCFPGIESHFSGHGGGRAPTESVPRLVQFRAR